MSYHTNPEQSLRESLARVATRNERLEAELAEVKSQLAESQRREQAAVEDLCEACKGSPCNNGICMKKNCTGNHIPCDFEWRGPQEAGEGETE